MIHLEIEDRCHSCPEFTPSVDKVAYYGMGEIVESDQCITCGNAVLCRRLLEYLKRCDST